MDERTELIETLSLIVRPESAAKMVDAFAHALAEEIRREFPARYGAAGMRTDGRKAADLIDPNLSRAGSTSVADTGRDQP